MLHNSPRDERRNQLVLAVVMVLAVVLAAVSGAAIVVADENNDTFDASGVYVASEDGPEVEIPDPIDVTDISFTDDHTITFEPRATFHSVGHTNVTVDIIDGFSTSVTTHDVSAGLEIDPDDKQAVTVRGDDVDWIAFYDVDTSNPISFDVIYGATDLAEITVAEIDADAGATIEAIDLDDRSPVDSATVEADSSVTFSNLPEEESVNLSLAASTGDITITEQPHDATIGEDIQATVQVTDEDGEPIEGADVQIQAIDGPGWIVSGMTEISTDATGEAVFEELVIEEVGTYSLSFSVSDQALVRSSEEFTISPADPDVIDTTVTPAEVVADGSDEATFTVTVEDEFGNPVADTDVSVEDAADELDGIDVGDTATTDADGQVEFTATATEVGDFTVEFNEPEAGSDSAIATFAAGEPESIEISTQPEDTVAGLFISSEVAVEDEFGNPVPGAVVEITADPDRIDRGTTIIETNVDGQAAFDDIEITEAGEYTFEYEVDGLTATSETFAVETAAIASLTVELDADEYLANGTHEATFTVTAEDMFGNPVEGADIEVTLAEFGLDGIERGDQQVTDAQGQAEFTATSDEAGEYTVEFEEVDREVTGQTTVTFVAQLHPFEIEDWYDLDEVRDGLDLEYVLVTDLDKDTPGYDEVAAPDANDGLGFEPIGDFDNRFSGTLDGNGYEVRNLSIDRKDAEWDDNIDIGLFGKIEDGTVSDVHLVDVDIAGHESVGGIAGETIDSKVIDASVQGDIAGTHQIGGVIGYQLGESEVQRTHVDVKIDADGFAIGGISGNNEGEVTKSSVRGTVAGSSSVGGISGTGGIIEQSYVLADVSGDDRIGGIAGESGDAVNRTYAAGKVSGDDDIGGLIGDHSDGRLKDSYWDTEATGQSWDDAVGEEGGEIAGEVSELNTDEMTGEAATTNMTAFTFGHVWTTTDTYPELLIEQTPASAIDSFEGESQVSSDDEPVEEGYTVTLDEQLEGVTVYVDASTFDADDIDDVSVGAVSDLVDEGETIEITTDDMGEAQLDITWSNGVDALGTVQASISAEDALVAEDDMDLLSLQIDTTPFAAEAVDITGDFTPTSDNEVVNRTYTVSVDDPVSVPVTLALDGFETEAIADSSVNKDELLGDGTDVYTDDSGEFTFWIEFAAGVEQSGLFVAMIDEDAHDRIGMSATGFADIWVDTLPVRADAIETINGEAIRFAPAVVTTDNEPAEREYVVRLNEAVEGAPVAFDASDFQADDIDAVDGETDLVDDLVANGEAVIATTNASGEAAITIEWAAGVDAAGDLETSISEVDSELLVGDDLQRLPIQVATELQEVEAVSIYGEQEVVRDNASTTAEYTIELDASVEVPVTLTLDGVDADDIVDEETDVDASDLVGDGAEITTEPRDGESTFAVTFAAGIEETTGTFTAEINTEDHARIVKNETDSLDVTVETTVLEADAIEEFRAYGDDWIRTDKESDTGSYVATLNEPAEGVPVDFDASDFDADDIDAVDGEDIEAANGDDTLVDALVSEGESVRIPTDERGSARLKITWAADVMTTGDVTASIDADAHEQLIGDDSATMSVEVDTKPTQATDVVLAGDTTVEAVDESVTRTYTASIVGAGGAIDRYATFELDEDAFDPRHIESVSEGSVDELLSDEGIRVSTDNSGNAVLEITFAAGADVSNGSLTARIDDADDGIGESDEDAVTIDIHPELLPIDALDLDGDRTPTNSAGASTTRTYTAALPERVERPVTFSLTGDGLGFEDVHSVDAETGTIVAGGADDLLAGGGVIMETDPETGLAELEIEFAGDVRADDELTVNIDASDDGIVTDASDSLTLQVFTERIEDAQYLLSDPIAPANVSPGDEFAANVTVDNVGGNATDEQDVIFLLAEGGADGDYTPDPRVAFEVVDTDQLPLSGESSEVTVELEAPSAEQEYGYVFVSGQAIRSERIMHPFDDSGEGVIVVGDPIDEDPAPPDDVDNVLDVTVEHVDGPAPDELPDFDVYEEGMLIGISLTDPEAQMWPQELMGLGVEEDTVFEVTVEVEDFTPSMLVGTGTEADTEIEDQGDGVTEVRITASPSETQFITDPEMPRLDEWPEGDEDQADIAFEHLFDFSMLDLEEAGVPEAEREIADGIVVMTNAQAFSFSSFSAPGQPGEGELALEVGGPGLDVDGENNEGYFDVFLPEDVVTEWGIEDPESHLTAGFEDEDVDFEVTQQEDGLLVELELNYSAGEASVEAQDASLDPAYTTEPAEPEVDQAVVFNASDSTADGEIVEYAWDFGDGETAEGEEVTHAFNETGSYDVTLTVTDEFDQTESVSETIQISEPDSPLMDYATDEGVIETSGLRDGVDDWRAGEIETQTLRDLVNYWRSGEPVTES